MVVVVSSGSSQRLLILNPATDLVVWLLVLLLGFDNKNLLVLMMINFQLHNYAFPHNNHLIE